MGAPEDRVAAGDVSLAADRFLLYNKAGGKALAGLTRRRKAERALFLTDDEPDKPEADTSQIVKETTTTTSAQPATDTQPAVVEQSVVQKITSSDQVKNIASTGMSSIGNKLASSTASGGMLEAVGGFLKDNMVLIICGTILVVVAIIVWLLIFHHSHKEKQLEATINANPNLNDIHFESKAETNA